MEQVFDAAAPGGETHIQRLGTAPGRPRRAVLDHPGGQAAVAVLWRDAEVLELSGPALLEPDDPGRGGEPDGRALELGTKPRLSASATRCSRWRASTELGVRRAREDTATLPVAR